MIYRIKLKTGYLIKSEAGALPGRKEEADATTEESTARDWLLDLMAVGVLGIIEPDEK